MQIVNSDELAPIKIVTGYMHYVMDGLRFTMLNETPCEEPHAGCCGDWGLETPGYPISHIS